MKKRGSEEFDDKNDVKRFHKACKNGYVKQVQEFIRRGIYVNLKNILKWTALHYAADNGHIHIVKVLIQNGADVNAVEGAKETPLHNAAENGHVDVAKVLIQNGADVNAVDEYYKRTPLHRATFEGHVDVAKVLIQNGADVNAVNENKATPLHRATVHAVYGGHADVDVAEVLIQNGADVNAVNKHKWTPLHYAAEEGHVVLTLKLFCFGAVIDEMALEDDKTGLLGEINNRLRAGKRPETSLMSNEEREWMWNLAFSFTIQYRAAAFKAYYTIRSYITFHGMFMADGYDLGKASVWKR